MSTKLDLTEKSDASLPATYKAIPEADMDVSGQTVGRPKSLISTEADGADEKMLPKEEPITNASPLERQNGDAKLDICEIKQAFVGLTKEELMKYATDPFWVRLRWFLFIAFWILWALMLLGAVLIILAAPKCNPPPPRTWWQKGPLVEDVDVQDESQIQKLKDLGVSGIIVTWPEDAYDNFDEKHPLLERLKAYEKEEIKVIVELEPGVSTLWFNQSESREGDFADYYIWQPPRDLSKAEEAKPPNNWVSKRNVSSWMYSDKRKEYFYAPTGSPHFNFRNDNVTRLFSEVIKKFLKGGFSGVRIKGAPGLLVDEKFSDEGHVQKPGSCAVEDYCFYTHSQTENLKGVGALLQKWREVVKSETDDGPFMIKEEFGSNIEAYKVNSSYVIDLPLQSRLKKNVNVSDCVQIVNTVFTANNISWPLWQANASSEWDIVTYLLPGTPLLRLDALENKELVKIRNSPSIMRGALKLYSLYSDTIFAYTRMTPGNPGMLVALNPTDNRTVVNFPAYISDVSEEVTVILTSPNYNETGINANLKCEARAVPLTAKSAIVLSYVPKDKN